MVAGNWLGSGAVGVAVTVCCLCFLVGEGDWTEGDERRMMVDTWRCKLAGVGGRRCWAERERETDAPLVLEREQRDRERTDCNESEDFVFFT